MSSDTETLKNEQYADAGNLDKRIALHLRFSQNRYGWCRWVFDRFDLPEACAILELGCGPGGLWRENCARISPGWQITLSDFSAGMLAECQANLKDCERPFAFEVIDAQVIPLPNGSLDAVIANHMLFHVPDRKRAFFEICRVLKPGGVLYATTVGENHLRELDDLVRRCVPPVGAWGRDFSIDFNLENGANQLAGWFGDIRLERYPDSLVVNEAEPIVDYVFSGTHGIIVPETQAALMKLVQDEIQREGAIRISKDSGMFIARAPVKAKEKEGDFGL